MESRWVWPFELTEKLGEGGMGVVYRGRYVKNDKQFAVKLLPQDIDNKTVINRFEREIQVLKNLRHPNIVRAFGGVCEDNQRFYAMELLEGGTITEKIHRAGLLTWEQVVDFGQQMCAGLAYAHKKGMIHRDIKPGNFLLTKSGLVKLSDFGLVSVLSEAKLTATGRTLGTVQYMSPEQIRGRPAVSAQSDIYSLGCVFYEMLTGHPPFEGDNAGVLMQAHLKQTPPSILEENKDCPAMLEQLILQMMSKSQEDRPLDCDDVSEKLALIRESPRLVSSPAMPVRSVWTNEKQPSEKVNELSDSEYESLVISGIGTTSILWPTVSGVLLILCCWLGWMAFQPDSGTDLWLETMKTTNSAEIRNHAADMMGKLASEESGLINDLEQILDDETTSPELLTATIRAIGMAGPQAEGLWSKLNRFAKNHPDEYVRYAAKQAQSRIRTSN